MNDTIANVMSTAASGLRAQSARMRIIAENIANAQSAATQPGEDPYRRQIPVFEAEQDRASGAETVRMSRAVGDTSPFELRFEPGHPAADDKGYVAYPNVSTLIEMMDMRTAQRAYEANLSVIEANRAMVNRTLDLLRR
jgi:flagellar basal-body rod protein FlgC